MFRESTTPLLRPNQTEAMRQDIKRIEGELNAPAFISSQLQDAGTKRKQLRQLRNDLENQSPKPYETSELDAAKRRHDEIVASIVEGMPTQAEMRRRPPGAVEKHMGWEKRHKQEILELKNIRLRMRETGVLDDADAGEIANIERFRPRGGAQELAMDGALIPGKDIHLPPPGSAPPRVMSDTQRTALEEIAPDIAERMATLSNEERARVLDKLDEWLSEKPKRGPSEWNLLQARARGLGINVHGKNREALEAEIAAKEG